MSEDESVARGKADNHSDDRVVGGLESCPRLASRQHPAWSARIVMGIARAAWNAPHSAAEMRPNSVACSSNRLR